MLFSDSFIFTQREAPKVAECSSHKFLLKGCFLFMVSSGIYSYLPLGWRVLNNINSIIRRHMNSRGAQEIFMSALQPIEIWQKTGRDEDLKDVMFTFSDRKQRKLCLGPTHEEAVTEIVRQYVFSYKQIPVMLYQIQTKFRDEPRPRFGLMRSCEFIMKDAYSFDEDEEGLNKNYEKMLDCYQEIFKECGLDFIKVSADSGAMGGSASHEFMVPSEVGEDVLYYCGDCNQYHTEPVKCARCGKGLKEVRTIEVGHIFKLGQKYSVSQEAFFLDKSGNRVPFIMGCYGIGVSRVLSAIAQVNSDDKGIAWPRKVAPFDINIVVLDKQLLGEAVSLSDILEKENFSVLVDDRNEAAGVKFNDAYLIGSPYILIMGKKYLQDKNIELEVRKTGRKEIFKKESLLQFLAQEYGK